MKDIRILTPPATRHEDFEWKRGMPKSSRTKTNMNWVKLKKKLDNGYYDFAICFWGSIGELREINSEASGNVFYIKENVEGVREAFQNIDWSDRDIVSAGAPQITSDVMVEKYIDYKQRWGEIA